MKNLVFVQVSHGANFVCNDCNYSDGQIAVDVSNSGGTTHSNSALERLAASAANHHHHQTPTLTLDRGPSATELLVSQGASSIETLLTNIQGLLKVATDNARQVDKQTNLERGEIFP